MAGFGNLVQKAFYLGVGIASYAGEKAGGALGDLRTPEGPRQIQILDDSESLTEEERQAQALREEVEALREELRKLK